MSFFLVCFSLHIKQLNEVLSFYCSIREQRLNYWWIIFDIHPVLRYLTLNLGLSCTSKSSICRHRWLCLVKQITFYFCTLVSSHFIELANFVQTYWALNLIVLLEENFVLESDRISRIWQICKFVVLQEILDLTCSHLIFINFRAFIHILHFLFWFFSFNTDFLLFLFLKNLLHNLFELINLGSFFS